MKHLKRFNESLDKEDLKNCISYISDEYDIEVQYSDVYIVYNSFYKNGELIDPEDYMEENQLPQAFIGPKYTSYKATKVILSKSNKSPGDKWRQMKVLEDLEHIVFDSIKKGVDDAIVFTSIKYGGIIYGKGPAYHKMYHGIRSTNGTIEFYVTTEDIKDILDNSTVLDSLHKTHKAFTLF